MACTLIVECPLRFSLLLSFISENPKNNFFPQLLELKIVALRQEVTYLGEEKKKRHTTKAKGTRWLYNYAINLDHDRESK